MCVSSDAHAFADCPSDDPYIAADGVAEKFAFFTAGLHPRAAAMIMIMNSKA